MTPNQNITHKFTDPYFRKLIQKLIGKEELYSDDVSRIKILDVSGAVESLDGLEYLQGLEALTLSYVDNLKEVTIPKLPVLVNLKVDAHSTLKKLVMPELALNDCCDVSKSLGLPLRFQTFSALDIDSFVLEVLRGNCDIADLWPGPQGWMATFYGVGPLTPNRNELAEIIRRMDSFIADEARLQV